MKILVFACALAGVAPSSASEPPPDEALVAAVRLEGDFDGDGVSDRVTAWLGRSGEHGFFSIGDGPDAATSAIFPIWSAHVADLEGDGRHEIVAGSWSHNPRHDEPVRHRAVWVFGVEDERVVSRWRGSGLARPLVDVTVADLDGDGATELISIEDDGESDVVATYDWTGFGFVELDHVPVPGDWLSFEVSMVQDVELVLVLDPTPVTVSLEGGVLRLSELE